MLNRTLLSMYKLGRSQWFPRERLAEIQLNKLKRVLAHAYDSVSYYRMKLREHGIKPSDIKSLSDIKKLPYLTKGELRNAIQTGQILSKSYRSADCVLRSTSGSSGMPMKVYFDQRCYDYLEAIYARSVFSAGVKLTDKIAYFWYEPFKKTGFWERLGIFKKNLILYTVHEKKQLAKLIKLKPDVIYCFPSTLKILIDLMRMKNIQSIRPRVIVSHGELLTSNLRNDIENFFGCCVFDHYGTNEFVRMAWECDEHNGLHYDMESVIIESVQIDSDYHELVFTGLCNMAMPLIRYRIGDRGRISTKSCNCGRGLDRISSLDGRSDDFLITSKGRIISPRIIGGALESVPEITMYQIIQEKRDAVTIYLENNKRMTLEVQAKIKSMIADIFDEKISVKTKLLKSFTRGNTGKIRAIRSFVS